MTKDLKALIEDLRLNHEYCPNIAADELNRMAKRIEEALAQPEQEPVAWEQFHEHMGGPFYVAPQRTWIGLTDDDRVLIKHDANFNQFMTAGEYADRVQQLTEARLKDLNT